MDKRAMGLMSLFTAIAFLAVPIVSCSRGTTAEEEVRNTLMEAVSKAEEKDVKGFMGFVSKDYGDEQGNSYDGIKGIAFFQFMRPEKLTVFVRSLDVDVKGDKAIAEAKVVAVRGGEIKGIKDIIPEDAAGYRFSIVLKREERGWKVTTASWKDIGVSGLL